MGQPQEETCVLLAWLVNFTSSFFSFFFFAFLFFGGGGGGGKRRMRFNQKSARFANAAKASKKRATRGGTGNGFSF